MSETQETPRTVIPFQEPVQERLLSEATVDNITGFSRSTRWRMVRRGEFPKPVQITPRRIAYRASDIEAWFNGLKAAR